MQAATAMDEAVLVAETILSLSDSEEKGGVSY